MKGKSNENVYRKTDGFTEKFPKMPDLAYFISGFLFSIFKKFHLKFRCFCQQNVCKPKNDMPSLFANFFLRYQLGTQASIKYTTIYALAQYGFHWEAILIDWCDLVLAHFAISQKILFVFFPAQFDAKYLKNVWFIMWRGWTVHRLSNG